MPRMRSPVQIGRSYFDPALICLAPLMLACLGIGLLLVVGAGQPEGFIGLVVGGGFLLLFVRQWLAIRRSRFRVTDVGTGFYIESAAGDRKVNDADVVGFASWERTSYREGRATGAKRSATLLTKAGETFDLSYRFKDEDPLEDKLARLAESVKAVTEQALAEGKSIQGDGWRYGPVGLGFEDGEGWKTIQVEDITAVEVTGRHLCVWTGADEDPVLRVPDSGVNVLFLADILRDLPRQDTTLPGLGRCLFHCELGWPLWQVIGGAILGLLLAAGGVLVIMNASEAGLYIVGGLMILGGLGLGGTAVSSGRHYLYCYENGVRVVGGSSRDDVVEFAELSWFSYSAVRRYVEGSYVGTKYELTLQPVEGNRINVGLSSTTRDVGFDEIRDRAADRLADRWCAGFEKGREQKWVGNTVLKAKGLSIPKGEFLRYAELAKLTIEEGNFKILDGEGDIILAGETSSPNFFAGVAAMNRMGARLV
jgi:hypothetical protein